MPSEDIRGVWGLTEVLDLFDDQGAAEHELHGELIVGLRAHAYGPGTFDRDKATRRLAGLVPDTASSIRGPSPGAPARHRGVEWLTAKAV
ncbi:hypothetical protein [Streptomyces sp. NPDC059122]|uniref:hypothetical protein n=1 Tax=Streptomyces sp. NPDC059122 TaxID=3346732 RepID=UPI0036AF2C53